jgi:hypothetical protein
LLVVYVGRCSVREAVNGLWNDPHFAFGVRLVGGLPNTSGSESSSESEHEDVLSLEYFRPLLSLDRRSRRSSERRREVDEAEASSAEFRERRESSAELPETEARGMPWYIGWVPLPLGGKNGSTPLGGFIVGLARGMMSGPLSRYAESGRAE